MKLLEYIRRLIDVKENNLKFIKEMVDEMAVQDCRATQYPMFVIVEDRYVSVGYSGDWDKRERMDRDSLDTDYLCEVCRNKLCHEDVAYADLPEFCDDCDTAAFVYLRKLDDEESFDLRAGVFFTADACQRHINANHYHYNNPRVFGIGSWRNPEMQATQQFLLSFFGKEVPSHYKLSFVSI